MQVDLQKDKKQGNISLDCKIQLPSDPIEDISTDFSSSIAELQDFFHVHEGNNRNTENYISFTMPGTTTEVLHDSIRNTLR